MACHRSLTWWECVQPPPNPTHWQVFWVLAIRIISFLRHLLPDVLRVFPVVFATHETAFHYPHPAGDKTFLEWVSFSPSELPSHVPSFVADPCTLHRLPSVADIHLTNWVVHPCVYFVAIVFYYASCAAICRTRFVLQCIQDTVDRMIDRAW